VRVPSDPSSEATDRQAVAFEHLFQAVYLLFHRRDGKRTQLSGASRAVLTHLSIAGPLTVGEAARHLDRAQSVVSDIVSQLEAKGLLEREADPQDRRRTLVWLTPAGVASLERDGQVLSTDRLAAALGALDPAERDRLLHGLSRLVQVAPAAVRAATTTPTPRRNDP
jgi:DNA-binding MarR family transcriptional regulator